MRQARACAYRIVSEPISNAPRSSRSIPSGLDAETLASMNPSEEILSQARVLIAGLEAGEVEDVLVELLRHRAALINRPPALETVLEALIDYLLPLDGTVAKYTGSMLYIYRIVDQPTPLSLSEPIEERLHDLVRSRLINGLEAGEGTLLDIFRQSLIDGLLELIQEEAVLRIHALGIDWLAARWIEPFGYEYIFALAHVTLTLPPDEMLRQALDGYRQFPEDEACHLLRSQVPKQIILPRLLAQAWPQVIMYAERLLTEDPSFAVRQDLVDITHEARRLLDQHKSPDSDLGSSI